MKRNLTYLGGLAALFGLALAVSTYNVDTNEVIAADSDSMTFEITCTGATQSAFVPDLSYTLTIAGGALATNPTETSHTIALSVMNSGVNAQVVGDIADETIVSDGNSNGTLQFWHSGPKIKTSGLGCTAYNSAALQTEITSADGDSNLDVSFVGPAATAYVSANKVDNAAIRELFGPTTPLIAASLVDGSDDDAYTNGEVVYGGSQYRIANQLTFLSFTDDATGTDTAVLKFTMD